MINLLENLQEANQVYLPNRYQDVFVTAFQGITGDEVPVPAARESSIRSGGRTFVFVRGRDIPANVVAASANIGVRASGLTGSEWCLDYQLGQQGRTPFVWANADDKPMGSVVLLRDKDVSLDRSQKGYSTVFPNLASKLLEKARIQIGEPFVVNGCTEGVAKGLGLAVVDLVSSGATAEANGFSIDKELLRVFPAITGVLAPADYENMLKKIDVAALVNGKGC